MDKYWFEPRSWSPQERNVDRPLLHKSNVAAGHIADTEP